MSLSLAIAPRFHLPADWCMRVRIPEGDGWRAPSEAELAMLIDVESSRNRVSLFVLPTHLQRLFWSMLERQAKAGEGDFIGFAAEVGRFLSFKELPALEGAVFDLIAYGPNGTVDLRGVLSVINLGDEPLTLAWPVLRLELRTGEGCYLPASLAPAVLPPEADPHLLVTIRKPLV